MNFEGVDPDEDLADLAECMVGLAKDHIKDGNSEQAEVVFKQCEGLLAACTQTQNPKVKQMKMLVTEWRKKFANKIEEANKAKARKVKAAETAPVISPKK